MKFECPQCHQHLSAPETAAGTMARCPSCDNRIEIPSPVAEPEEEQQQQPAASGAKKPAGPKAKPKSERKAWKEADPTNPNFMKSFGIGFGILVLWYAILFPFNPKADVPVADYNTMQFMAALFYKHLVASILNTLFFAWAMAIIWLKLKIIRHQRAALLLDVLPTNLGKEICAENVGLFIDHVYALPVRLRDSLMVNRIRKALELFEIRQNVADVREMMVSQSDIDGARIGGSYSLLRAFLWGIPLVGFIGTVVGLSHAIGGMSFANVEDVSKIVSSINNVTSGLGTAFDATLLGLVLALALNFPLNALAKQEDENLHAIDAFCNEVLLPRLKESASSMTDTAAIAETIVRSIAYTQEKFLVDLNELARRMNDYSSGLDAKMEAFQKTVTQEFVEKTAELRTQNQDAIRNAAEQIVKMQQALNSSVLIRTDEVRKETDRAVAESLEKVTRYLAGLESGIGSLNRVLKDLGEKQINVTAPAPRKRGWFGG